jgi:hypothetical protein
MFYLTLLLALIIQFIIAEFLGRSKHIGRWWMFLLLSSTFIIGGLLAWLLSPSAKKNPSQPNSIIKFAGIAIFIFGGLGLFATVAQGKFAYYILSAPISLMSIGAYLWALGLGNIKNNSPKYYFNFLELDKKHMSRNLTGIFKTENNDAVIYYFLKDNDQQLGPFTYEELKERRINENHFIWKPGFEFFKKASEIEELKNIIVYLPPNEEKDENNITKQGNFTNHKIIESIEDPYLMKHEKVKELQNETDPPKTNDFENISIKKTEDTDHVKILVNLFAILYSIHLASFVINLLIIPKISENWEIQQKVDFSNGFSGIIELISLFFIIYYRFKSNNKKIGNLLVYIGIIYIFWLITNGYYFYRNH